MTFETPASRSVEAVRETLTTIWKAVLEVETVQTDDNFFMLGGDSLKAAALMVHIEESFDLLIDPIEIFEHPVLTDFSELIAAELAASQSGAVEEGVL